MGSGAPPWRQAAGRDTHPLLAAKDAVLAELGPEAVVRPEFDDLGVLAATLTETTAENLLSLAVVLDVAENPIHHLFAQTVPYGFGIVQVFTVRAFGPDLGPLAGAVVSVVRTGFSSVHIRSRRAPLGAPERGTMGRTAVALSGSARGEGAGCARCG